jgi:WD40 repeat protein
MYSTHHPKSARVISLASTMFASAILLLSQPSLTPLRLDRPVVTGAISPDGQFIVVTLARSLQHADGSWESGESVQIIQNSTSRIVAKIDIPSVSQLNEAPLSSDGFVGFCDGGRYVIAYDLLGTVYILDSANYAVQRTINLGDAPYRGALGLRRFACAANSEVLAVNESGGMYGWGHVRVFDLATGKQVSELTQSPSLGTEFSEIDIAPNGSLLVILLRRPNWKRIDGPDVEIRNTRDLKLFRQLSTQDAPRGLAFAGDSTIVTVQEQPAGWRPPKQALRIWNIATGREERHLLDGLYDTGGPVSASSDGQNILGAVTRFSECHLCNGLEGRIDVKEQRFAVWRANTGAQAFRSEPFGPIIEPFGARCVISQDGRFALIYWPDSEITPRVVPILE